MLVFIIVPVVDKNGKRLEDLRVNATQILKYRSWLTSNKDDSQTLIFFNNGDKLIVDCTVNDIDKQIEEQCTSQMA